MNEKHFLDTSVLRPILTSSPKVKKYYNSALKGGKYTCEYINMEFLTGYIRSTIEFYFLLAMPQYGSFAEALYVWTHRFGERKHKNIETMIANLLESGECVDDKQKSLRILADYIRRLIGKLYNSFKRIGNDNTYCTKGKLKLQFDPVKLDETLRSFVDRISDKEQYENCNINRFVKQINKNDIAEIIKKAHEISVPRDRKGFDKIIKNLKPLINEDNKEITCFHCAKIGDAIIALLSNPSWCLEHTDYSFNYLCDILGKRHSIHPYDVKIMALQNTI